MGLHVPECVYAVYGRFEPTVVLWLAVDRILYLVVLVT